MGQVVLEGKGPFLLTKLKATSATAKDRTVQLEFWLGGEGDPVKTILVPIDPDQATALARRLLEAVAEVKSSAMRH